MKFQNSLRHIFFLLCILLSSFSYAQFDVHIKNRKKSISGEKIEEKSIPYENIRVPEQEEGDVLFFDAGANGGQGAWRAYPISGLNFVGGWNVEINSPKIYGGGYYENAAGERVAAVSGDYFVVTNPGISVFDGNNLVSWSPGDWLIFNGEFWDRISNNGTVGRVFGRKGHIEAGDDNGVAVFDYNWSQVVKEPYRMRPQIPGNFSSIFDIEDVEGPANISNIQKDSVLKWDVNTNKWIISNDEVGITGLIQSSDIVDGEILDEDISPNAAIDQNKIAGLAQALNQKLDTVNGTLVGDLETASALIFYKNVQGSSAKINGVSLEELHQKILQIEISLASKEDHLGQATQEYYLDETKTFSLLNSDDVEEVQGGGEFLSDERVVDTILSEFDSFAISANTGGVLQTESLVEAFRRFQDEISNASTGLTFDENDIPNESIDLSHLANDSDGSLFLNQAAGSYSEGFLIYEHPNWKTELVSGGLTFKSPWDASSGVYPTPAVKGDFFIVDVDGTVGTENYVKGDWLVCINPPPVAQTDPPERWLRINNAGQVYGFKGAKDQTPRVGSITPEVGDYTWAMIDKTNAVLSDLSDVDLTKGVGDVLKYRELDTNGDGNIDWTGWTLGDDETGAGNGQINGGSIISGSVTSSSIKVIDLQNGYTGIKQSKFSGLSGQLAGKLPKSGGVLSGNLDLNQSEATGLSQINASPLQDYFTKLTTIDTELPLKEDKLPDNATADDMFFNEGKTLAKFDTDSFPEGQTNLYFTDDRVFSTLLNIGDPSNPPDVSEVVVGDTIGVAIQKMESQIKTGTVPTGSLDGSSIDDGAITLGKLAKESLPLTPTTPSNGDTYKVLKDVNGDLYWGWSSITGINYKSDWDVLSSSTVPINALNGDYYILSSSGDDANGDSWDAGDWAIYDEDSGSFQKIPTPGIFQKFNGVDKHVMPVQGDYTFDMLDFSSSSIGYLEDVDITTSPPTNGQVLKYQEINGVKKWAPGSDNGGLSGKITTDEVIDSTVKSDAFVAGTFKKIHFQDELQDKIDEHYESGDVLASSLNFGGKNLTNCNLINGIDVIALYNNCSAEDPSDYLETLPAISYLSYNASSYPDHSNGKDENYFLNEKGNFSRIHIDDLGAGATNATFDPDAIRALPLKESFHMNLPQGEPEDIEDNDTLWEAFAKIWKKASRSITLTPKGFEFESNYFVDKDDDNQKTLFITQGNVTLPDVSILADRPKNGFVITIKRKSLDAVNIVAGAGNYIDDFEKEITLNSNYASVRLVFANTSASGSKRWHIIHKHGEVE